MVTQSWRLISIMATYFPIFIFGHVHDVQMGILLIKQPFRHTLASCISINHIQFWLKPRVIDQWAMFTDLEGSWAANAEQCAVSKQQHSPNTLILWAPLAFSRLQFSGNTIGDQRCALNKWIYDAGLQRAESCSSKTLNDLATHKHTLTPPRNVLIPELWNNVKRKHFPLSQYYT